MQKSLAEPAGPSAEAASVGVRRRWRLPRPSRFLGTVMIALVGPILAAGLGAYLYLASGRIVSTDNAYVKADKIVVSPDVSGRVTEVMVHADEHVARGAVLFHVDPELYKLALDQAEADLDQTRSRVEALRAEYREAKSELKEAEDRIQFYDAQRSRQKQLADKGVGRAFFFEEADSNADAARTRVNVARQKMHRVLAQLGGDSEIASEAHPMVRQKIAARDRARVNLDRTVVRAPAAGIVTNFDLQPGEYISVGSVAFSLVGTEDTWIQANFKETELTYVKVGQRVVVHVDMYPETEFKGRVTSIGGATGAGLARWAALSATRNWDNAALRLPVHVRIDEMAGAPPLRPGMSVIAEVDTEHRRALPRWAKGLFGWATAAP